MSAENLIGLVLIAGILLFVLLALGERQPKLVAAPKVDIKSRLKREREAREAAAQKRKEKLEKKYAPSQYIEWEDSCQP